MFFSYKNIQKYGLDYLFRIYKDSYEIIESVKYYADGQDWIIPKNIDSLAKFYLKLLDKKTLDIENDNRVIMRLYNEKYSLTHKL